MELQPYLKGEVSDITLGLRLMASSRMIRMMICAKIAVLQLTNLLTGYAMSLMTTYLSSVWKLNPTHAAAIVNVYYGAAAILPLWMHFVGDALMGNYRMIVFSDCAYTMGFLLLTMSTPPVLHRATGTCSAYETKCVGQVQKVLFYIALPLIALGASGRLIVETFSNEHFMKPLLKVIKKKMKLFCYMVFPVLVGIGLVVAIGYIKSWFFKFGMPAVCASVATLSLLIHLRPVEKAKGCPFTWEEIKSILRISPICCFFIVIGVVSSIGNTYFTEQASQMNHKFGSIKASILFLLVPQGIVRAVFSSIEGCGANPRVGISVSMALGILCCIIAALVESRRLSVVKSHGLLDKPDEAIPMSMFWLLPQFLLLGAVAGLSEKSIVRFFTDVVLRWPKIKTDDDEAKEETKPTDKNNDDSSVQKNKSPTDQAIEVFKHTEKDDEVPDQAKQESKSTEKDGDEGHIDPNKATRKSQRRYIWLFARAVAGVGNIGSVLSVYAVSEVKPTWFQDTLNRSHLDKYYWTLAVISAANLVLFILVIFYLFGSEKENDITADEEEEDDAAGEGVQVDAANVEDLVDAFNMEVKIDWAERQEEMDEAITQSGDKANIGGIAGMKEQLNEAKNQLSDEANINTFEQHENEQKEMALNLSHVIDITDERKEKADKALNQSSEESKKDVCEPHHHY